LDDAIKMRIDGAIRDVISARFVPNAIIAVPDIPRTMSGKKLELPVKKLLLGRSAWDAVNRGSMANPEIMEAFIAYAEARQRADT